MHPKRHRTTIYNIQDMKQLVSINRVMDKDVVHIQWNISHKKERNNAVCSNMDKPRDYHIK